MVFVVRVVDGFEEFEVSGSASDILGRAGALAADAQGQFQARLEGQDLLDLDLVLPVIAWRNAYAICSSLNFDFFTVLSRLPRIDEGSLALLMNCRIYRG